MVVLSLIWGILSLFVYLVISTETQSAIDVRLQQYAFRVISQQLLFATPFSGSLENQQINQDLTYSVWLSWPGHVKLLQGSAVPPKLLTRLSTLALSADGSAGFYNDKQGESEYRIYEQPVNLMNQKLIVQTASDIGPELEVLERLLLLFGFAGLFGIILTMVGGYALGKWTLRPLMKAREREQEFLADVSHELRTPLSVMQTNLELMLRHVDETSDASLEWVEPLYKETIRMRKMVDDLLDMAKIDAGMSGAHVAVFSLSAICDEVAKLYEPVFTERGIEFITDITEGLHMGGDGTRIRQLLFILLDNANKYTFAGRVALQLVKKGTALEVSVQDSGIGIPASLLPRVTERFFRADVARTQTVADAGQVMRKKNSSGLGLAIAKRIVEAHQGKLTITSEEKVGTTILIRFVKNDRIQKRNTVK
jgi:signal transduction histidine kinase